MRSLLAVLPLCGLLLWFGQPTAQPWQTTDASPWPQLVDGEQQPGEQLYLRDCSYCHGPGGEGSTRGTALLDVGAASAHYYLTTGRMPIADPDERPTRGDPAYTAEEIDELVAFVAGFGDGPAVPVVRTGDADAAAGGVLYRRHCAQCHGATGVGTALAFDEVAPSLFGVTPVQTVEAMLVGPGAMPGFTPTVLTLDESVAVAAHVETLQDPVDPGGLPLARAGRFDEMLVAWIGGLGLILLAVRWIARER
jgi:ubiquinol-cytochrome c reductase cytochrome c subunit